MPDNSGRAVIQMIFSFTPEHYITITTKATEISANLIDLIFHIWTDSNEQIKSGIFDAGRFDHFSLHPFLIHTKVINHKFREESDLCIDDIEKSSINDFLWCRDYLIEGR